VTSLQGVLASGLGQGAHFTRLEWVRHAIRRMIGFDPYPGTLNLRLVDAEMLLAWRRIREEPALLLTPPPPERCGARLFPVVVAPDIRAVVVVPDVTRHGDDVLELVAAVHVRSVLGLQDDDRVRLAFPGHIV
jgi:CTP-dependent riboflavin kinase